MCRTPTLLAILLLSSGSAALAQPGGETLIRGGDAFVDGQRRTVDVRIVGETIAEIGPNLVARDASTEVIDASGRLVLPGGVDPHVHIFGNETYDSASRAALAGGITTFANFGGIGQGETPIDPLNRARPDIAAQTIADVIYHPIVSDPTTTTADTLETLAAVGQTTIKVFMVRPTFDPAAAGFMATLRAALDTGVLTMIHAEDAAIVQNTAAQFIADGRGGLEHFADARPVAAEVAATQRAVAMAEATGAPIYLVHLSAERALRIAEDAQARGVPVYVETRPIYLHLTRDRFQSDTPGLYIGLPPLGTQSDVDALWDGLERGTIHVVGTDHVGHTREQKLDPSQDVARHRAGMSNLQVMLPMLHSEGVREGRLSLDRFVEVTSTNPAKLFGIYPRKGVIAVGSDADLVMWNTAETRTIRDEDMFSASGYSVYSGREVTGWPTLTMRRGEIVYRDGVVTGVAGSGELLTRERWREPEF